MTTTTPRRRARAALASLGLVALLTSACSSGGSDSTPTTGLVDTGSTTTITGGHTCDQGATTTDLQAAPVAGVESDWDVTSFDGTTIRAHWFPTPGSEADRKPTLLMGPGWSLAGSTIEAGALAFGALDIKAMNDQGYNVLTWDPRGFGKSTGQATVDAADREGRDVQVLLDWVAEQPEALLDRPGDPRTGMVGFSYGGGIQLTVASIDCRVDAIVPGLAWHSLGTSLYKAATVKSGWSTILTSLVDPTHLDPHIVSAAKSGIGNGTLSDEDRDWFLSRGPGDDGMAGIDVPTLFVQGTVDTLFTLDEAITNYRALRKRGVPTAMLWFCGGHGTCLTATDDMERVTKAQFAWLDRYVKGDAKADVGPALDLVDQDATVWTGADYPVPLGAPVTAQGSGTLTLEKASQAGPISPPATRSPDLLRDLVVPVTPAKAATAVDVSIDPGTRDALALGAPSLHLEYRGTSPDGVEPTRVFAQLVDDEKGVVVGNQITPIDVTLDGQPHTADVPLEVIAQHLEGGHTLTLQLVATTVAYATPRLGGSIDFSVVTISIPVAKGVRKG